MENNQYILDISKDEAKKLGVSPELYNVIKEEIAFTNNWIKKMIDNGDTVDIPDIQFLVKEYKKVS